MNTLEAPIKRIIAAAIMSSDQPLNIEHLKKVLLPEYELSTEELKNYLSDLMACYEGHGFELKEVASGYRFQVCQDLTPWVQKLWQEKPVKYSRALLETLALIVYRQPITRAEIEEIRGVAVSTTIIKTLLEREWVRIIGYKELPGKPALYATTKSFLNDFNLKSLSELPPLSEITDLDQLAGEFESQIITTVEKIEAPHLEENPSVITDEQSVSQLEVEVEEEVDELVEELA